VTTDRLSGELLRRLLISASVELEAHRAEVDALNVFPVPDGDTGTNMNLTVQAAIRELQKCNSDTVSEVGKAVSLGSLMGARGNSGVILSQLFRGMGRRMEGHDSLSPAELAAAFQSGVDTAYKAVMRPVEGTILTVAKEMARSATRAARDGGDVAQVMQAAQVGAEESLAQTPDLLPVLKQAGVVDAGGKGLLIIIAAMTRALLLGEELEAPVLATAEATAVDPHETLETGTEFRIDADLDDIEFTYDTQLLIRGHDIELETIRSQLTELGDSMLVVGTAELAKVHIHTNHPGQVLEICLGHGDLSDITIDNMREQYEAIKERRAAGNGEAEPAEPAEQASPPFLISNVTEAPKQVSVVTVAVGEGLEEILRSLGAEIVVSGGQTMNPSTEELVRGISAARAPEVLLVPNNTNILMAAEQALQLVDKKALVVPTRNIPQGIAAMLAYNPQATLDINRQRMVSAMGAVRTGEITYAVRSTSYNEFQIDQGDVLAIVDDEIIATGSDPQAVLTQLLERLVDSDIEFVTILYGADITEEQARAAAEAAAERYPGVELEVHRGGQPLFYYLVSVE